jgi:hypothetical protein
MPVSPALQWDDGVAKNWKVTKTVAALIEGVSGCIKEGWKCCGFRYVYLYIKRV